MITRIVLVKGELGIRAKRCKNYAMYYDLNWYGGCIEYITKAIPTTFKLKSCKMNKVVGMDVVQSYVTTILLFYTSAIPMSCNACVVLKLGKNCLISII